MRENQHSSGVDKRQTAVLATPAWRMISPVPTPSAVSSTIRARQTCFCGLLRSSTIASNQAWSEAPTLTTMPARMAQTRTPAPVRESQTGLFRQG